MHCVRHLCRATRDQGRSSWSTPTPATWGLVVYCPRCTLAVNWLCSTLAKLSKAERNYCVTRSELLATLNTLQNFCKYLFGQEFHLRTGHSALTWLLSNRNLEGQTARWVQRLQEHNFTSKHRQSIRHINADILSRRPCTEECSHCRKVERTDGQTVRVVATAAADGWDQQSLR